MSSAESSIVNQKIEQALEIELNPKPLEVKTDASDVASDATGIHEMAEVTSGLSNGKAMFLVFRSLVGVGILTIPSQINQIGILGALICYPSIAMLILYCLDLMVKTANDIKFYDQR